MRRLVHLLSGLEIGGKERIALKLAHFVRGLGLAHDQTAFRPMLYGVGIAVVLTLLLKETGPAARSATVAGPVAARTGSPS